MSVDLCDVDVDVYLLAVESVVPFLLVDADLDIADAANFVSQHLLDADVDAIHDFADSILDVNANLVVVDSLVVDALAMLVDDSLLDVVEVDVVYLSAALSLADVDVLLLLPLPL